VADLLVRFAKSDERRFDDHIFRLREFKRGKM